RQRSAGVWTTREWRGHRAESNSVPSNALPNSNGDRNVSQAGFRIPRRFGMPQSNSETHSASNRHWGYSTAGRVFFGWGVLEELRAVAKELGTKVMVCADKNIIKSGIAEKVENLLKEGGAEVLVFPDGRPDIDLKLIESCAEVAR